MAKAFLCHSSKDKDYVGTVARHLGRARVAFDEMSFEPGADFRSEIRRHLDKSTVFVFVVSTESLQSTWCQFELEEAETRAIAGQIQAQLSIIIDRNVAFSDLPDWLQGSRAVIQTRPNQAVRDIQHVLFETHREDALHPFVGRQDKLTEFVSAVSAPDSESRRVLVVSGLEGIGRRSYLLRAAYDNLGLRPGPVFFADATRGLDDLYLWVMDETSDLSNREKLAATIAALTDMPEDVKVNAVVSGLKQMCGDQVMPIIVDRGALLTHEGSYRPEFARVLEAFADDDQDCYLGIVHTRIPRFRETSLAERILHQQLGALDEHESQLLLKQLWRRGNVSFQKGELESVNQFLGGYPPSAYFASSFAGTYGTAALLADPSLLVDFQAKKFVGLLEHLKLDETAWVALKYLASEEAVPLDALALALDMPIEDCSVLVRDLIDRSLVFGANGLYGISSPIRDAVFRSAGYLDTEFYKALRDRLHAAYWSRPDSAPSIEVVDATLHAVARSGSHEMDPYSDLVRVSTVHRLAEESYHRKEYPLALAYARRAAQLDPERVDVHAIVFKSFVQLERWAEAEVELCEIDQLDERFAAYLRGFMLKRRRRFSEAITEFERAMALGLSSYSVRRDYAECLYRAGRLDEAMAILDRLLEKDRENVYVLDLYIRICLDAGELKAAEARLVELDRYDKDRRFIHHRRASLYGQLRHFDLALIEAEQACKSERSPFEAFSQKADIQIELGQYEDAARTLDDMSEKFETHGSDVVHGLRCKLEIRSGSWKDAWSEWQLIKQKNEPVNQALLERVLRLKAQDATLSPADRAASKAQANEIQKRLSP